MLRVNEIQQVQGETLVLGGTAGVTIPGTNTAGRPQSVTNAAFKYHNTALSLEVLLQTTWHYIATFQSVVNAPEVSGEYTPTFPNDTIIVTGSTNINPPDTSAITEAFPNIPIEIIITVIQDDNGNHTVTFDNNPLDVDEEANAVTVVRISRANSSSWTVGTVVSFGSSFNPLEMLFYEAEEAAVLPSWLEVVSNPNTVNNPIVQLETDVVTGDWVTNSNSNSFIEFHVQFRYDGVYTIPIDYSANSFFFMRMEVLNDANDPLATWQSNSFNLSLFSDMYNDATEEFIGFRGVAGDFGQTNEFVLTPSNNGRIRLYLEPNQPALTNFQMQLDRLRLRPGLVVGYGSENNPASFNHNLSDLPQSINFTIPEAGSYTVVVNYSASGNGYADTLVSGLDVSYSVSTYAVITETNSNRPTKDIVLFYFFTDPGNYQFTIGSSVSTSISSLTLHTFDVRNVNDSNFDFTPSPPTFDEYEVLVEAEDIYDYSGNGFEQTRFNASNGKTLAGLGTYDYLTWDFSNATVNDDNFDGTKAYEHTFVVRYSSTQATSWYADISQESTVIATEELTLANTNGFENFQLLEIKLELFSNSIPFNVGISLYTDDANDSDKVEFDFFAYNPPTEDNIILTTETAEGTYNLYESEGVPTGATIFSRSLSNAGNVIQLQFDSSLDFVNTGLFIGTLTFSGGDYQFLLYYGNGTENNFYTYELALLPINSTTPITFIFDFMGLGDPNVTSTWGSTVLFAFVAPGEYSVYLYPNTNNAEVIELDQLVITKQ